uniref:Nck-associated protein 5 C-terminal domain-containing protein n=1 Tax=Knipowitschia caucasica TaxID=637954 RepID=A0AAV2K2J4_KNICA
MPVSWNVMTEPTRHAVAAGDAKLPMLNRRSDSDNGSAVTSPSQDAIIGSGCTMRTLDSGIGTIPLPESCSFFSSILHLLPKSSSSPEQALSPSPLPRWRVPSSLSDPSVPFPSVAFVQPTPLPPDSRLSAVALGRLPRPPSGDMEPKKNSRQLV